ncbi:MAG: hypothetical protein M0Z36_14565 [Thermaerobacter sp.]|nr:hypothetical protein [Thermaerobacter sp.]
MLLDVTPEHDTVLRRLMRKYGLMLRFAFKRWVEGLSTVGALECHLSSDTTLPLRYTKDAVQEAQDLIRARHQAMQDGLALWTQRVRKTRDRLTALRASLHPNGRRLRRCRQPILLSTATVSCACARKTCSNLDRQKHRRRSGDPIRKLNNTIVDPMPPPALLAAFCVADETPALEGMRPPCRPC